jgi:hypothetical protein
MTPQPDDSEAALDAILSAADDGVLSRVQGALDTGLGVELVRLAAEPRPLRTHPKKPSPYAQISISGTLIIRGLIPCADGQADPPVTLLDLVNEVSVLSMELEQVAPEHHLDWDQASYIAFNLQSRYLRGSVLPGDVAMLMLETIQMRMRRLRRRATASAETNLDLEWAIVRAGPVFDEIEDIMEEIRQRLLVVFAEFDAQSLATSR